MFGRFILYFNSLRLCLRPSCHTRRVYQVRHVKSCFLVWDGEKYRFEWTISPPKLNVTNSDAITEFTDVTYYVILAAYLPYWLITWSKTWVINREISVWRHLSKRSRQVHNSATVTSIKFGLLVCYDVLMTVNSREVTPSRLVDICRSFGRTGIYSIRLHDVTSQKILLMWAFFIWRLEPQGFPLQHTENHLKFTR